MSIVKLAGAAEINWRDLPPLPQSLGGQFVGTIGERLVVAGGSHWDGVPRPWAGGTKVWSDAIYTLERGAAAWKRSGTLPSPLGYGVTASTGDAMLCVGGQTPQEQHEQGLPPALEDGGVAVDTMPALPAAAANTAGALCGDTIYVAAGRPLPPRCRP